MPGWKLRHFLPCNTQSTAYYSYVKLTEIIRTKLKFAGSIIMNAVIALVWKLCCVIRSSLIYIFFEQLTSYAMFGSFLVQMIPPNKSIVFIVFELVLSFCFLLLYLCLLHQVRTYCLGPVFICLVFPRLDLILVLFFTLHESCSIGMLT